MKSTAVVSAVCVVAIASTLALANMAPGPRPKKKPTTAPATQPVEINLPTKGK